MIFNLMRVVRILQHVPSELAMLIDEEHMRRKEAQRSHQKHFPAFKDVQGEEANPVAAVCDCWGPKHSSGRKEALLTNNP